jgi:AraC-like DNA-binding protein
LTGFLAHRTIQKREGEPIEEHSLQYTRLTTDSLAAKKRLPFWQDVVCDTFVELECESARREQFFGSLVNRAFGEIQFSAVESCSQRVVRTRSKISRSEKDFFLLSLQTSGRCLISQDGRTAMLQPGDFALYDTTQPYDLSFDEAFGQLVVRLPRALVTDRLADAEQLTARRILGSRGTGLLASNFLRQLHASIDTIDPLSMAPLHTSALDLLATALAEQLGTVGRVSESHVLMRRRVCAFIDANLDNCRLSCEMIAAAHRISERYLRKVFESSSMNVSEWIWSRRLLQAKRDLLDPRRSHVSVTAIGYDVGFKDAAHFSRAFKLKFGETPSSCRAKGGPTSQS